MILNLFNGIIRLVFDYPVYTGVFALSAVFAFIFLNKKRKEKKAFLSFVLQCFQPLKMLFLLENGKLIQQELQENFHPFGQAGGDYILGCFKLAPNEPAHFLGYQTDKHLLSIAPTRTGKGRGLILPNLLDLPDHSVFVIDPKGENALVSARYRQSRDHKILIFNPYKIHADEFSKWGFTQFQSFNPLANLNSDSPDFADDG